MKYYFFGKLGKMSQNLSSAAVVIGASKVNQGFEALNSLKADETKIRPCPHITIAVDGMLKEKGIRND